MKNILLIFSFLLLISAPVMAQQKKATEIEQAETYFANLKTVKSRFIQTNADGSQLRGTFYLNRPGKLRFGS
jgi:outer membrane lipoprotein-sorting protein